MTLVILQMAARHRKRDLPPFKMDATKDTNAWYAYLAKKRLMDAALIAEQHNLSLDHIAAELEREIR